MPFKTMKVKPLPKRQVSTLSDTAIIDEATCFADLTKTKSLRMDLDYDNVRHVNIDDFDFTSDSVRLAVGFNGQAYSVNLIEQPECCANLMITNLPDCNNVTMRRLAKVAFLAAKEIADRAGYSYLWFTHIQNHGSVLVATQNDFHITREYKNKRTKNTLVDVYAEI